MRRRKPQALLAHEALLRNITPSYTDIMKIKKEYYKLRAGFTGEKQLDYRLNFLPDYFIKLPDIRLKSPIGAFQMDSLIITPKVIFIVESKFLNGSIEYRGKMRQLVQYYDGREKTYKDPILQANIQRKQLEKWLAERGYILPVIALAVSTNEYASIEIIGEEHYFSQYFITLENVCFRIEELYGKYKKDLLTPVELQRLVHQIHLANSPKVENVLEKYRIQKRELLFGIRCSSCNHLLQRHHSKWICANCNLAEGEAHRQKIYDYFLLIGDSITNAQCRVWLGLEDDKSHVVKRILRSMKLKSTGERRYKKYLAPPLADFPQ